MAKISELGAISGANTRSEDLFVIVNLVQGDDGTKNITRKELVQAIQYEEFDRINITGGKISGVVMRDSRLDNVVIDNSDIEDTTFVRGSIDATVITNSTANNISITYSDFIDGAIYNGTANNVTINQSQFYAGVVNNTIITSSEFNVGTIADSTGNNVVLTSSELNDSTANNIVIENSEFNNGTANTVIMINSQFNDGTVNNSVIVNSTIQDSTGNNVVLTSSQLNDSTGNNSVFSSSEFNQGTINASAFLDGTVNNTIITSSEFNNGTGNNNVFTNSEFNDGTGNNVILTNSTIDDSTFTDGTISNTAFQGTMENVVATDMTIRSSSADGLSSNNSSFDNGTMAGSVFSGGTIDKSKLVDFDMELNKEFEPPLNEESYFAIRNEKTGATEQINFAQLFDEVSKKTAQALKVNVDAGSGDDANPGTMMQPVRTLERAFELCLEKAGGDLNRNAVNNAVHISVGPGTYYTKGNLMLPDDCSCTSTAGQYATVIELLPGYENNNGILVGSGGYVQGFGYQNFEVDNFDFPEGGFAIAYRPGAKLLRSPYLRDSTQLSNFRRQDVEPPLNPYNSKGTLADLGRQFYVDPSYTGTFAVDDEVTFSSGAVGFITYVDTLATNNEIYVRNLKNGQGFKAGNTMTAESGGVATITSIGIDDFPNRLVGRGGGCVLADRRVLDTDSLYTYVLCFGFTPRTQNGLGYVARDGAGINGIGSLSIFVRCAFYALNGGQMTLNNSGTQFGDISMRAKGSTVFMQPRNTTATIIGNTAFADTIDTNADDIIDDMVDFLSANTAQGGLDYTLYDSVKCERDSGIILDGVAYDIALDTNYWSRLAGISYRSPISSKVIGEQLDATIGANEYLQGRVEALFGDSNPDIVERANTSFQELYNVVEYGEENINPVIWRDTENQNYTNARELLQDNKELIQDELIDWIENNGEFYAYNSKACRRDVQDYILPAVENDMLLDTNYNTVTAGRAYYMATAKTVMENQNNETVAAYKRLKDQTNELVDGDSYLASQRLDVGFDEILSILENKGTQFTPPAATYDPSTGLSVITLGTSTKLTPSTATYDPATGIMVATIGVHELTTDDHIWFKPEGMTFSCDTGSGVTNHAVPEAHHPYYNKPCPIIAVTNTTITMNVGVGGTTGQQVHTFVSAVKNALASGHGLGIGRKVLLRTGGLIFTCDRDNNVAKTGYPRASDPAAGTPIDVIGANETKITINVGKSAIIDDHTFVEALPNSVSVLGSALRFSDDVGIGANNINARKQLQANKEFIQEHMLGYIDYNFFRYDSDKCRRDVSKYILPAVERDILTGTNYNAIQTGLAYRSGTTLADNVINEQLVETSGAITELRSRVNLNNTESGFTVTDATYDPATGRFEATIGAHTMATGDYVLFADEGITFSCDMGAGQVNHTSPQSHHPYYRTPCPITSVTATTIVMNVGDGGTGQYPHTFVSALANAITPAKGVGLSYTPTTASYDPVTGKFTAVIGPHSLKPGDMLKFATGGVTFSCDTGSGPQNDSVPALGHPYYNHPCPIESVTRTSVSMFVGTGGTNVHTFVSALTDALTHMVSIDDNASGFRSNESFDEILTIMNDRNKLYSTTNATYDPVGGMTEMTIGSHDFQVGDQILIAPDSLTFTCATDSNVTEHTYPTTTISTFSPTNATYVPSTGVFTATIGTHKLQIGDLVEIAPYSFTFTCEMDDNATNHLAPEPHHPFYKKKIAITAITGNTITMNVGSVINGGGVHTFVSALPNSIEGERQHPAYKKPVTVAAKTGTTISVNVGPSTDVSVHTYVSSTADNIKPAQYTSAYTPTTATYNASTGVFVATIGSGHNLVSGDYVMIKPGSVVFTCAMDGNVYEHAVPQGHHPFYKVPVVISSVTTDTITMNVGAGPGGTHVFVSAEVGAIDSDAIVWSDPASYVSHFTPTTATFVPATGDSVITLPTGHGLTTSDYIEFAPYSFTFTCAQDGDATEHSYPRKGDLNYRVPMAITAVNGNDVTVNLGASTGGLHTFVSVEKDAVSKVTYNSQGQYAREQLQINKTFLEEEVTSYLDSQYFVFDGDKCSRDTGFILDAVRRDVATGSNYNSVFMGLGYRIGTKGSNEVVTNQLTETVGAINYIKSRVAAEASVTGTALTRANAAFDEIVDIMSNGRANADALVYGTDASVSVNHTIGSNALINNRAFIVAEVTAYIAETFPAITYNVASCERDTGYLIDAIVWDLRFGSNTAAINFARLYFENAISTLPEDQKLPTAKTWEHIANVAYDIVRDIAVTPTTGNGASQDVSLTDAGVEVGEAARAGINVTTQIIRDNNLKSLPTINEGSVEAAMAGAVTTIDGIAEGLQSGVIDFLREEYNGLAYAKNVCKRDVGILVDAVSRDIEYGGNENTIEALQYYFKRFNNQSADYEQQRSTNVLPLEVKGQFRTLSNYEDTANVSGLREAVNVLPYEQRESTKLAFAHLADVAEKVVKEVNHTTTFAKFTPTDATYDPATGVFTATIGAHNLVKGDSVWLKPEGFVFSCDMGVGSSNHTSPQAHHPFYNKAITITDTSTTVITMNVGGGGSGQFPHTFVSADALSISEGPYQNVDGTAADTTTGTAVHDLLNLVSSLVDDTNIETAQLPTLVKASYDSNRTLARKQLQRNRDFIIEEVQGYIKDRYYTFDGDKCKADLGFILDAVKADVLTGSNYNSIYAGLAYNIGTTNTTRVLTEQLTETVSGINYAKKLCIEAVTDGAAKLRVEQSFNEIIDIMTNGRTAADVINYTSTASNSTRINARSQLQNNKSFLTAEITAWLAVNRPSLSYDVAKCERDTGYLIDAITFDAQHQGNFATINFAKLYFENAILVGLPESQIEPTTAAYKHLGDCASLVVQDINLAGLKSAGNAASQDFSAASAGAPIGNEVEGLFDIVANAILNSTMLLSPPVTMPTLTTYSAENQSSFGEIENVKKTAQNGVLSHLAKYFEVLPYSEVKCRRDTGYIVDAISHDIQYGGNAATVQTAGMYFENAVNTGLQIEQRMGSRDAFLHMAKLVEHVVGAKHITTTQFPKIKTYYTGDILTQYDYWNGMESYQSIETQDTAVHGANPNTSIAARKLAEIVANAVDDNVEVGTTIPEMIDVDQTWQGQNYVVAKEIIEKSKVDISEKIISYLSNVHSGLSFRDAKCRRDIGYLIDAVSHDIQYGTNFATRQSAGIYFENGLSVLPVDTRAQTATIYDYLGTVMSNVVQEIDASNTTYSIFPQDTNGTAATATEGARVDVLMGYIESVIRANDTDALPAIEAPTTTWVPAPLVSAKTKIMDNSETLASDVTDFINSSFTVLDYDRTKCRRDTEYLIDAFSFDMNFGGNTASRWNADFYFWNQVYRLPEDQRIPTAKSYRHLGRICKDIVIGEYAGQKVLGGIASVVESTKVQGLADMFYKTQLYNDTKYLQGKEEPTYSSPVYKDASDIIGQNRVALSKDTVRYVGATYKYIDGNLTRRDARNLLTAIQNDFKYEDVIVPSPSYTTNGSSNATMTYTASFFNFDGRHVFPVFNGQRAKMKYQGSIQGPVSNGALASKTGMKPGHAYIIADDMNVSHYTGTIYYWDGSTWQLDGPNNTDLLDAFAGAWDRMRTNLVTNYSPDSTHSLMIEGLFNDCLKGNVLKPSTLIFGSLVESIAHQFNGASAGVNRNALPLNFRNLGSAISAIASVLNEDGGRIRWSGADELNNQYFARGLKINGRTGRIEGRPFTSSVRKLARRASNSRANI